MRKAFVALFLSIAALAIGAAICLPGICGCATSIPGVDGENYIVLAIGLDVIGLLGIVSSIAAMPIIHLRRLRKTAPSQPD